MVRRIATTAAGELLERELPLRSLTAALDAAGQGQGAVVVVSGEPGIGKSTLVSGFAAGVADRARVLVGLCDELTTPRPLGAFRDIAAQLPETAAQRLAEDHPPGEIAGLLVEELRQAPSPTVLVIEDVHWADQATIDVVTVVGRRITALPVLLVLTVRLGELEPDDPLRAALDAVRRSTTLHVELAPLTRAAVEHLAGAEAERIYELSQGNPFFVAELLEHGADPPPPSLANAVLGRVARLEPATRSLLELLSVVPGRVTTEVLDHLEPRWAVAAEPAERRRLLRVDARHVRFRHELTRAAIRSSLPWGRRRQLHRRILEAILHLGADPADVVHHAAAAGAVELAATYALPAGREAAASGAHREALAHLRRAAEGAEDRLEPRERVTLYEDLARSAWLTGELEEALEAASRAIRLADALDDHTTRGRCASLRAHLHWFRGDGAAAWRDTDDAVRSLEATGPSADLARAYAQAAELSMLVSRLDDASRWGHRALLLAGDDAAVTSRALTAIGGALLQLDTEDTTVIVDAVDTARDTGEMEQVVFSLVTLAFVQLLWVRPGDARSHAVQARAYAADEGFDGMTAFIDALLAWLDLREGRPEAAASRTLPRTGRREDAVSSIAEQQARLVLAELAVRTGADDARTRLDDAAASADRTRKLVHLAPVLELQVEQALTDDAPLPRELFQHLTDTVGPQPLASGCGAAHVAAWAAVCGETTGFQGKAPPPHEAMLAGDWRAAADAFGAVGWQHDRALLLSLLEAPDALEESLAIARSLGAAPLERRVRRRMRSLGLSVPRGPRASTQANPAQLTDRQLDVLRHVAMGRTNGQVAELLSISPRTVEHHVAGILAKLQVPSRAAAVARAAELGLP